MYRGIVAVIVAALVMAVAVAGCGSSSGSDSSSEGGLTTSSLSRAAYTQKAEEICYKRVTERNTALATGFQTGAGSSEDTREAEAKVVEEATFPRMRTLVKELEALGAPSGDEAQIEGILNSIEAGNDSIKANPQGVLTSRDPYAKTKKLAYAYGFHKCGQI